MKPKLKEIYKYREALYTVCAIFLRYFCLVNLVELLDEGQIIGNEGITIDIYC